MPIQTTLVASDISAEQYDYLARECQAALLREPGIDVSETAPISLPGRRGNLVTLGTFVIDFVTSGAVTRLFDILKSYVDRADFIFEGLDSNGKPLKIRVKGASLEEFKIFLNSVGVVRDVGA